MNEKTIALVGSDHDVSLRVVREHLQREGAGEVVVLDGTLLGQSVHIEFAQEDSASLKWRDGEQDLNLRTLHSVWFRRWHEPAVSKSEFPNSGLDLFVRENWVRMVQGAWLCTEGAKWVNRPASQEVAANKLLQLQTARELGFETPRTLITTDPLRARAFIESCPTGAICKALGNHFAVGGTSTIRLEASHLEQLASLTLCPAIFQECVPVRRDIRVIVVGDEVFAGEIDTAKGKDEIDWRLDPDNPWTIHKLPSAVAERCLRLTKTLDLSYGAVDLRWTPDGAYVFFEINPAGQFMFLEAWTRMPIAATLARFLLA